MRKVHPSRMVAHLWANQSQDEARTSNGNFYFTGDTIYSYGSHFPIACHVDNVVLFTTASYSNTTAQHKSKVRRACSHKTVFEVPFILPSTFGEKQHVMNFRNYQARINTAFDKFKSARFYKRYHLETLDALIAEANNYASTFKLNLSIPPMALSRETMNEMVEKSEQKREKAMELKYTQRRAAQAKWEAQQKLSNAEKIAQWINGEDVYLPYNCGTYLRVKNGNVQTSKGALVPLEDARRLFAIVQRKRNSGQSWRRNSEHCPIGQFEVDSIDSNGNIVAGCHNIHWDEIARFAASQNW